MSEPTNGAELDVDQDYANEFDSDYGSSVVTDTTSLATCIIDYVYENGRRYHRYKEGSYLLPNDEAEQDRLDMHHHIFRLLLQDKLHLAPIEDDAQYILDVGTGTGIWAIEMAEYAAMNLPLWFRIANLRSMHPSASVTGTDLSPIQPKWVPPNCSFEVDDAEMNWTFPKDHFDLIHSRNLMQSIKNWPKYLKEIYKHTRPGGYVDIAELESDLHSDDNSVPYGSSIATVTRLYSEAIEKGGLPQHVGPAMKAMVEAVGFVDVQLHRFKQPLGSWPKDPKLKVVGQYLQVLCETGFEAYTMALFTRVLGIGNQEVVELVKGAIKDSRDRRIHSYNYFYHIVGRKPEDT